MSHSFYEYKPKTGDFETRRNGVLVAFEEGVATFYAFKNAEDRGVYFIKPGVKFSVIEGLLTNFHLPKSSLLLLVSALIGRKRMLKLYKHAISNKYRFFSYGDAMLITPESVI